jgi:hypothetical protein
VTPDGLYFLSGFAATHALSTPTRAARWGGTAVALVMLGAGLAMEKYAGPSSTE